MKKSFATHTPKEKYGLPQLPPDNGDECHRSGDQQAVGNKIDLHHAGRRVRAPKAPSFLSSSAEGLTGEGWVLGGQASLREIIQQRDLGAHPSSRKCGHSSGGSLRLGPHCAKGLTQAEGGTWGSQCKPSFLMLGPSKPFLLFLTHCPSVACLSGWDCGWRTHLGRDFKEREKDGERGKE